MKKMNKFKLIFYLILGGFFFKIFKVFYKKTKFPCILKNFREFLKGEKREIKELSRGQESFSKYCGDSCRLFRDYFIPHDGNSHKPKILRTQSLAVIVLCLFFLKIVMTGYLFFIYPYTGKMSVEITNEILRLVNEDRAKEGLGPLAINTSLSAAAMAKADDMVINNYFAHHSPDGKKPWDWIDRGRYAYLFVGENLAMNFSSARSAHTALMASPTHRKNIMNERYRDVGLAMVTGKIDGKETNVLVQLFGTRHSPYLAVAPGVNNLAGTTAEQKVTEEKPAAQTQPAVAVAPAVSPAAPKPAPAAPKPAEPEIQPVTAPVSQPLITAEPERTEAEIPPLLARGEEPAGGAHSGVDTLAMADAAPEQAEISPNPELENNPETRPAYYEAAHDRKIGFATRVIDITRYLMLAALALMTAALLINIFVRISIQHKHTIIQSLVVIILIAGMLSVRTHILERMSELVAVL